jgi:hypothetical protein
MLANIDQNKENELEQVGFQFGRKTVHTSRTIMFAELEELFSDALPEVSLSEYKRIIVEENCLMKRSAANRKKTAEHLTELYALDNTVPVFFALRYFWDRDTQSRKQLAILCAYCRDTIFRASAQVILDMPINDIMTVDRMQAFIEKAYPERFSEATAKSLSQSINSSWTQVGFFEGKIKKIRQNIEPTIGALAYALFLGHLSGKRGQTLFETEFVRLINCSKEKAIELGDQAARLGWINQKRIGSVVENSFPQLIVSNYLTKG